MAGSGKALQRDVETAYPKKAFIAKLRRLADSLERGEPFRIQMAGRRIAVPKQAIINIEKERGADEEEVEFQLKGKVRRR